MISSPRPYKPLSGRGPGGASRPNPVDRPLPAKKPPQGRTARPPRPKPLTDMQIAQQELAPVIGQITGAIQGQAQHAGDAVKGYTGSLAQQLAGIDYGAPYRQAVPQQAAVDEALRASLAGKGADLSQGLSSRLAALQEPGAVQPAAASVAQFGQAAGNTQLASGSAALSALLANQAAAGEYGAKQPGIAREAGLQGLSRVQGQALSDIASQTAPLYAKLPDIVQAIQQNRVAVQGERAKQQQLQFENALAAREYGLKRASTAAGIQQGNARVQISAQNAATSAARVAQQALSSDRSYQVNLARIGISKKSLQLRALTQDAKLKGGGFTPAQVQRFKGTALTLADQAIHGFTDAKGGAHPALTYQQAVLEGQKEGIPLSILLPALRQVGYVSPAVARKQSQIANDLFPDLFAELANR